LGKDFITHVKVRDFLIPCIIIVSGKLIIVLRILFIVLQYLFIKFADIKVLRNGYSYQSGCNACEAKDAVE